MQDLTGIFNKIYDNNSWSNGSGPGSNPVACQPYIRFLERFLLKYQIKSIVDLGCGDWQLSSKISFGTINYLGVDVSSKVIDSNSNTYSSDTVKFMKLKSYDSLPYADLLICKDVLQHLAEDEVFDIINTCFIKYRYILITNCIPPYSSLFQLFFPLLRGHSLYNRKIKSGEFTYFDPSRDPYSLDTKRLLTWKSPLSFDNSGTLTLLTRIKRQIIGYTPSWRKSVHLIVNKSSKSHL